RHHDEEVDFVACTMTNFIGLLQTFFFFQAEDGIRDKLVTGVQTCALPISSTSTSIRSRLKSVRCMSGSMSTLTWHIRSGRAGVRSEERRVGKECRSGWWPDAGKKQTTGLQQYRHHVARQWGWWHANCEEAP